MWAALTAAAAVGGCGDDVADPGVSPDLTSARGASPYLATSTETLWPDDPASDAEDGRQLYIATCAACHGAGGQGLPHQGPGLCGSGFLAQSSEGELLAFLVTGRPVGDRRNTSGIAMPPRGGNPYLTDRHLGQIIAYLRTMNSPLSEVEPGPASIPAHPEELP
jgi:disulfide bond formation protein DsbB